MKTRHAESVRDTLRLKGADKAKVAPAEVIGVGTDTLTADRPAAGLTGRCESDATHATHASLHAALGQIIRIPTPKAGGDSLLPSWPFLKGTLTSLRRRSQAFEIESVIQ